MKHTCLMENLTFHSVGQGLFYTGEVDNLNFVYDCGSEKRNSTHLDSAIKNYKSHKLHGSRIDLLILSHLHEDHASGLDALLSGGTSVDTAILPYLLPIERLMVALRRDDLPQWFYDFLSDPVQFLIEQGVGRVVLLGGREPSSPEPIFSNEESFRDESGIPLDEMDDDEYLKNKVLKKDPQLERFPDQKKLFMKSHKRSLRAKGIQCFRFFNCKVEDSNMSKFEQCVERIIKGDDVIRVIRNKSKRRRLRGCYRVLHGDFNNTSLVVYHEPILSHRLEILLQSFSYTMSTYPTLFFTPHINATNPSMTFGQLLTGDIDLKQKWAEIRGHYNKCLSKVSSALVPHHGADKNWNRAILKKTPRKCAWIASFGVSNAYGHPSNKLIQDTIRNGNILYWCNEFNEISAYCMLGYKIP